jgi:hypothetical protein
MLRIAAAVKAAIEEEYLRKVKNLVERSQN